MTSKAIARASLGAAETDVDCGTVLLVHALLLVHAASGTVIALQGLEGPMDQRTRDEGLGAAEETRVVVRRAPLWAESRPSSQSAYWRSWFVALIAVWIERRPIATHFLKGEFERRGVQAKYHLDKVGFRTQQVSDLVIGDPSRPDLRRQERDHPDAPQARWQLRSLPRGGEGSASARTTGARQSQLGTARQASSTTKQ